MEVSGKKTYVVVVARDKLCPSFLQNPPGLLLPIFLPQLTMAYVSLAPVYRAARGMLVT